MNVMHWLFTFACLVATGIVLGTAPVDDNPPLVIGICLLFLCFIGMALWVMWQL